MPSLQKSARCRLDHKGASRLLRVYHACQENRNLKRNEAGVENACRKRFWVVTGVMWCCKFYNIYRTIFVTEPMMFTESGVYCMMRI